MTFLWRWFSHLNLAVFLPVARMTLTRYLLHILIVFHEVNRKITEKFTILMAINPLNNQIKYKVKLNYLPLLIGNQPFLFMDLINLIPEWHVLSGGSCSCLGWAAVTVPSVLQSINIFIWKSAIINNNVNKIERT